MLIKLTVSMLSLVNLIDTLYIYIHTVRQRQQCTLYMSLNSPENRSMGFVVVVGLKCWTQLK